MSLVDLLPRGGDGLAVHAGGTDHSWSERAGPLRRRRLRPGRRRGGPGLGAVGVLLPDGVDLVAALFAVWRAGGVYVPLNPR